MSYRHRAQSQADLECLTRGPCKQDQEDHYRTLHHQIKYTMDRQRGTCTLTSEKMRKAEGIPVGLSKLLQKLRAVCGGKLVCGVSTVRHNLHTRVKQ